MTQKEIVTRFLLSHKGKWIPGYILVGKASSVIGKDYLIQDADTRAHELAREGYYDSPNNRYYIEHRKKGKYAEFRCTGSQPLESLKSTLNAPRSDADPAIKELLAWSQEAIEHYFPEKV